MKERLDALHYLMLLREKKTLKILWEEDVWMDVSIDIILICYLSEKYGDYAPKFIIRESFNATCPLPLITQ